MIKDANVVIFLIEHLANPSQMPVRVGWNIYLYLLFVKLELLQSYLYGKELPTYFDSYCFLTGKIL